MRVFSGNYGWWLGAAFLSSVISTCVHAQTLLLPHTIEVSEVGNFRENIKNTREAALRAEVDPTQGFGYTECIEFSDLPGVVLCGSYEQITMNYTFMRASWFAEGGAGYKKGEVARLGDLKYRQQVVLGKGHDIQSHDLAAFFRHATDLNPYELQLKEALNPLFGRATPFVVIGFSIQNPNNYRSTVGHELVHAQYFLSQAVRDVVHYYYREVLNKNPVQLAKALAILTALKYDIDDPDFVANEVAAFLLEPDAEVNGRFKELVKAGCREQLLNEFVRRHVKLITIP